MTVDVEEEEEEDAVEDILLIIFAVALGIEIFVEVAADSTILL